MPYTTVYKKWDIVLVSFPFTDFTSDKRRPAIIISPDSFNVDKDVTIAFVTSQINAHPKVGDHHLKYWKEAGLPKASMIRMKFATIDKSIIVKKIGSVEQLDRDATSKILISFFGL